MHEPTSSLAEHRLLASQTAEQSATDDGVKTVNDVSKTVIDHHGTQEYSPMNSEKSTCKLQLNDSSFWNRMVSFCFRRPAVHQDSSVLLHLDPFSVGAKALPPSVDCYIQNQTSANASQSDICNYGTIFGLCAVVLVAVYFGLIVQCIGLPPLLGMLTAGILLRNLPPPLGVAALIDSHVAGALRRAAFVVILIEGGLGLDVQALRRLKFACIRLAAVPCLTEAVTVALISYFIFDFPVVNGLLLGFTLGAVSPAVCVPSMLSLQNQGYGVTKGIPTLVIAASSVDDVLAITAFSLLLSLAFSKGGLLTIILMSVVELIVGILYGIAIGVMLWFVPEQTASLSNHFRFVLLLLSAMVCMFGSTMVQLEGAGAIGCLVLAFVANIKWSIRSDIEPVRSAVSFLWRFPFEPLLFALIGAQLDVIGQISLPIIGKCLIVLIIGLIFRTVAAFMVMACAGFTLKERLFIALAWLPKATVQAALAPVFYDSALAAGTGPEALRIGLTIVSVAVLGILLTAPTGAVFMACTGPRLLQRKPEQQQQHDQNMELPSVVNDETHVKEM